MGWIIAIIAGGLIGWIASIIMKTNAEQGTVANILIGIVGAIISRWLFADVLGVGAASAAGGLTFWGLVWGVVGAVILISILRATHVLR